MNRFLLIGAFGLISLLGAQRAEAILISPPSPVGAYEHISRGFDSCERIIAAHGYRTLTHGRTAGSIISRAFALQTCKIAVTVAYDVGLPGDVVAYTVPAWGVQESSWASAALGDAGELGPLQIKSTTCASDHVLGRLCAPGDGVVVHVRASLLYLKYMRRFGNGSWAEALSAYRVGPGAWRNANACIIAGGCTADDWIARQEGQRYASAILTRQDSLRNL